MINARVSLLGLLLTGCAELQMIDALTAGSVYLQHPVSDKIAECEAQVHVLIRQACIKRWQERGYIIGDHDILKGEYDGHPKRRADVN